MTQPDTDLVSILDSFTNYVLNERVRAYNEGFDAGRAAAEVGPVAGASSHQGENDPAVRLDCPTGPTNYNTENYSYKAYEKAIETATIERCAKFAEDYFEMEYEKGYGEMIADAMRLELLKDKH